MKTLTIVCPVYNEEEVIVDFYANLKSELVTLGDGYKSRILFVTDRSTDRTLEILKEIATKDRDVLVLALSSRFGHQMSILAGIDHSDTDALIMMDSDLQHPPSLIREMLRHFENGYDIVYTVRRDLPQIGIFKRLSSKLFYRFMNSMSQVPIHESASDFRLISRRVATVFRESIRERNQFLRGLFSWIGFRSIGISFEVGMRRAGRSKYSLRRLMRFGIHGIVSFSKRPLQASILLGLLFAAFGLINGVITFFHYFAYSSLPSGWTTLVILISVFSGVQLISLGIIGEYIGAIFDEVKARPHYIVDERINFPDE